MSEKEKIELLFYCEVIVFRYIPVGLLEHRPGKIGNLLPNQGRTEMETLLMSRRMQDWIKISEMFCGRAPPEFQFYPTYNPKNH